MIIQAELKRKQRGKAPRSEPKGLERGAFA